MKSMNSNEKSEKNRLVFSFDMKKKLISVRLLLIYTPHMSVLSYFRLGLRVIYLIILRI